MGVSLCGNRCPELVVAVFVVVTEVFLGIFIAVVVTSEVSKNKINSSPTSLVLLPGLLHGGEGDMVLFPSMAESQGKSTVSNNAVVTCGNNVKINASSRSDDVRRRLCDERPTRLDAAAVCTAQAVLCGQAATGCSGSSQSSGRSTTSRGRLHRAY
ncbi:hypothetical protein BDA96_10G235500 [Sorghum bicolor]|uniref:Uncharacterized protein n=2 Tax=Sorghum bicolor TaxID=4558 RepID=A0A921U1P3_SORBI|nr:hypothetical protein BDA96_10G235500 [Sorghum bicolor]KXG20273.1 hypothetical protein SORBI_3010G179300 [Sorghum bicolor]